MLTKIKLFLICFILAGSYTFGQGWYIGVYNNNINPTCSGCHGSLVTAWEATGHAIAQDSISFLSYSCLGCHNTGWDPATVNGGADEFVTENAGSTPDWTITDQTRWDLVKNVQCESCHGPVGSAENTLDMGHIGSTTDFKSSNCGVCHEGSHHPYMAEWEASGHASGAPAWLTRDFAGGSCAYCHFTQDFVAFLTDENYNGATFVPEGDLANNEFIDCAACHDPHGNDNPGNLRVPVGTAEVICDVCHTVHEDVVDVNDEPHHTTSEALSGAENFGYQYPGQTYQNSPHTFVATERCIDCHVNMIPYDGEIAVTGHTFEPTIESCARAECHGEAYYSAVDTSSAATKFDLYGAQTTTDSLLNVLAGKLADASSADSLTDAFKQARYNLLAVEAEGSHGIHNTKLVQDLLIDAIANFSPTDVEYDDAPVFTYSLDQNYPNPFNPSTKIKFTLTETADVTLTVFDALGKTIDVLVDGNNNAGSYEVTWNAENLASGIYFYKLETKNFVQTKKMLLMK
ncbi:MAG: ammonia-forming cytochrome c nitrite reductase subunit c552 [Ignavibacteriae bacterium]|nr:ammonia-forming cytochrome c nitrite reductase subunit c552 [Ignavibacteriota bacterium]NOG99420.1 ammonia-forming cytochrome c nitrite reductase subunit c552 [Ignavibacteriota bacterium]